VALNYIIKSKNAKLVGIYLGGNAFANVAPSIRNFYNIMSLYDITNVPIWAGSYYALQDVQDAADQGHPFTIVSTYRSFIPSDNINAADTMYGQDSYLPQGRTIYDLVRTADSNSESIVKMLDTIAALPANQKVTLISTGSLTPLAILFSSLYSERTHSLLNRIAGVVQMGGAFNTPGNVFTSPNNNVAEFNIIADPHAAQWAFGNLTSNQIPVTLVPLDATNDVPLEESLFSVLTVQPQTPEAQLVGRLMQVQRSVWFSPDYFNTAYLWDPTAVIVALRPDLITESRTTKIRVIINEGTFGSNQGATRVCSPAEAAINGLCFEVNVVYHVNGDLINRELIATLQSPINSARHSLYCLP
jgi:inosine-uridine nucleoside N-ribohydrolase